MHVRELDNFFGKRKRDKDRERSSAWRREAKEALDGGLEDTTARRSHRRWQFHQFWVARERCVWKCLQRESKKHWDVGFGDKGLQKSSTGTPSHKDDDGNKLLCCKYPLIVLHILCLFILHGFDNPLFSRKRLDFWVVWMIARVVESGNFVLNGCFIKVYFPFRYGWCGSF